MLPFEFNDTVLKSLYGLTKLVSFFSRKRILFRSHNDISFYFIVLFEKFKCYSEFTDQRIIDLSDLNLKFFSSVSESLRAHAKFFIATNGFFFLVVER